MARTLDERALRGQKPAYRKTAVASCSRRDYHAAQDVWNEGKSVLDILMFFL